MLDKDAYNFRKPTLGCETKGSQYILVLGIDVRAMFEKNTSDFCLFVW